MAGSQLSDWQVPGGLGAAKVLGRNGKLPTGQRRQYWGPPFERGRQETPSSMGSYPSRAISFRAAPGYHPLEIYQSREIFIRINKRCKGFLEGFLVRMRALSLVLDRVLSLLYVSASGHRGGSWMRIPFFLIQGAHIRSMREHAPDNIGCAYQ